MSCISLNESLSIDALSLEMQRQHLLHLIAEYETAVSRGCSQEHLYEILVRLLEYTYAHVSFEERLLCYSSFSEAQRHCREHAILKDKIVEIMKEMDDKKKGNEIEILTFLVHWLRRHVLNMDKQYSHQMVKNEILL